MERVGCELDNEKFSYDDSRKPAKDFEKHGIISTEEREILLEEFDRIEERSTLNGPRFVSKYDKEKYPTIHDYLRENIRFAINVNVFIRYEINVLKR